MKTIIVLVMLGAALTGCVHTGRTINQDRLHRSCTDLRIHDVACPGS